MRKEDELNEKMMDKEQKDNLDAIKQDDHQDYGDKGDDHAGMKEPEVTPSPEVPGALPEQADVVLALDLSGSFADAGLLNTVQNPAFLAGLDANLAAGGATDVGYGIASFIDVDDLSPTGFLYHTDQPVTQGDAQTALSALVPGTGGVSIPEAQLVALQQVGLQAEDAIGYRDDPDVERFVVLATDSAYNQAGAFPAGGPNDNDTDLTDGTSQPFGYEDYPSIAQVAGDLAAANVTPIFAVTADEVTTYTALRDALNAVDPSIGGSVVELSPDSANLADQILAGLTEATAPDMLIA